MLWADSRQFKITPAHWLWSSCHLSHAPDLELTSGWGGAYLVNHAIHIDIPQQEKKNTKNNNNRGNETQTKVADGDAGITNSFSDCESMVDIRPALVSITIPLSGE